MPSLGDSAAAQSLTPRWTLQKSASTSRVSAGHHGHRPRRVKELHLSTRAGRELIKEARHRRAASPSSLLKSSTGRLETSWVDARSYQRITSAWISSTAGVE